MRVVISWADLITPIWSGPSARLMTGDWARTGPEGAVKQSAKHDIAAVTLNLNAPVFSLANGNQASRAFRKRNPFRSGGRVTVRCFRCYHTLCSLSSRIKIEAAAAAASPRVPFSTGACETTL